MHLGKSAASTAVLLVAASMASAQDATTTQTTTVTRNVIVSGGIETVTPWAPNYDDGVFRGDGSYIDSTTTNTTARSLNTSGNTATAVGNFSAATSIAGSSIRFDAGDNENELTLGAGTIDTVGTFSQIGTTSISGSTSINTSVNSATTIGRSGNATLIRSTSIAVGHTTDATDVSIATGSAANTVEMGNAVSGTNISATAGNASSIMQNGSITDRVALNTSTVMLDGSIAGTVVDGTVSTGSVIANNGSRRMIADENGKIVVNDGTDTTTGSTASMYVTNSSGNVHGLVVQETKTTLSGGINSGSMTLDDRGATFSNPADGSPIQVHGVADGTAPFDAVNVRQLYSGLAAVLASTPEIALAPGKTGMAVGLGGYGNYGAIGIGFGHMYENGTTLKASASKGQYSELAYRASVSWNW